MKPSDSAPFRFFEDALEGGVIQEVRIPNVDAPIRDVLGVFGWQAEPLDCCREASCACEQLKEVPRATGGWCARHVPANFKRGLHPTRVRHSMPRHKRRAWRRHYLSGVGDFWAHCHLRPTLGDRARVIHVSRVGGALATAFPRAVHQPVRLQAFLAEV